jgi:hypothetical protein
MNRREIIQYIRQKTVISEEQKISLMHMLYKHSNNFDSLCRLIKSLNMFSSEVFQELLSFEKAEIVKTLIQGVEERISNDTLGKLVEIFFGKASYFLKVVLSELQKETECQVRALMTQLIFHFKSYPIEGSRSEDYLSGLHHPDELFRCKILNFLYKHYGGEALPLILKEAINIIPPPSLFFYMTLNHYLRLHPEINWDEDVQKTIWSRVNFSRNQIAKDGIEILFEQMQHSILRHEFLSLIHTCEQPRLQISNESDREPPSGRLERFKKINFSEMEVNHVSLHDDQNRDIGSRNSEKDAIRSEI